MAFFSRNYNSSNLKSDTQIALFAGRGLEQQQNYPEYLHFSCFLSIKAASRLMETGAVSIYLPQVWNQNQGIFERKVNVLEKDFLFVLKDWRFLSRGYSQTRLPLCFEGGGLLMSIY